MNEIGNKKYEKRQINNNKMLIIGVKKDNSM